MSVERIGVFCGARPGRGRAHLACATRLGTALGLARIGLVYGGSAGGVMGALADAVLAAGGHVTGVFPRELAQHDPMKAGLQECHVVRGMHERKELMYRLSDAFIALPGGFGTCDELFETLTWKKIGLHDKPVVLLNVDGYYDALLALLDRAQRDGFISAADRDRLHTTGSVDHAIRLTDTASHAVPVQ